MCKQIIATIRALLIILSPVYLMLIIPFIWLYESVKVFCELIYEYIDFLRCNFIPDIKETFRHIEKR